jgi:hypothetical protein
MPRELPVMSHRRDMGFSFELPCAGRPLMNLCMSSLMTGE